MNWDLLSAGGPVKKKAITKTMNVRPRAMVNGLGKNLLKKFI